MSKVPFTVYQERRMKAEDHLLQTIEHNYNQTGEATIIHKSNWPTAMKLRDQRRITLSAPFSNNEPGRKYRRALPRQA